MKRGTYPTGRRSTISRAAAIEIDNRKQRRRQEEARKKEHPEETESVVRLSKQEFVKRFLKDQAAREMENEIKQYETMSYDAGV